MSVSVHHARKIWEVMKHELLRAYPDLEEDQEALIDTLDGVTDLTDQIAELLRTADMNERFADAIGLKIEDLGLRKARLKQRTVKMREICLTAMADADIKKIEACDMTISRRRVPPKVMIIDQEKIPRRYFEEVVTHKLLKAGIKTALVGGMSVPGTTLSNASEGLSVRTK